MTHGYTPISRPADLLWRLLDDAARRGASEVMIHTYGGGISNLSVSHNGRSERFLALPSLLESSDTQEGLLTDVAPYCVISIQSGMEGEGESGVLQSYDGRIVSLEAQNCKPGMEISVTNLYFNLPDMYRKYRSAAQEKRYCLEVIRQIYLGYGLSMRWLDGSGPAVYIPAGARLEDRMEQLHAGDFASHERLPFPSGTLMLLPGPQYVSAKYGICMLVAGAPCRIPALSAAYEAICAPYRQDADVPGAVLLLDAYPDDQAVTAIADALKASLPEKLTQKVRAAQPTRDRAAHTDDTPHKITLYATAFPVARPPAPQKEEPGDITVQLDADALHVRLKDSQRSISIPISQLKKYL